MSLSQTGITGEWFNEIAGAFTLYGIGGLDLVVRNLKANPVKTYEERRLHVIRTGVSYKGGPAGYLYSVDDGDRETVRMLDRHVGLINAAVCKGRLTDEMFRRLYNHISDIVHGDASHKRL